MGAYTPVQTSYADAPAKAYAGMLVDGWPCDIASYRSVDASEIQFGFGVVFDPSAPVTDQDVQLPAAETNIVAGIVVLSHSHSNGTDGDLGTTGLKTGAMMDVLRKGRIWVVSEDGNTVGQRAWVRCTTGGPGEVIGGIVNADEGTETINCENQAVFLTAASAGGLAILEVDFTNKPGI